MEIRFIYEMRVIGRLVVAPIIRDNVWFTDLQNGRRAVQILYYD
jgi:hypothetical protein